MFNKYNQALILALKAHKGQKRRGGDPYVVHPIRVSNYFETDIYRTIAVLHDVVEDSDISTLEIFAEFGVEVATAVDALTKRGDESYEHYIERLSDNEYAVAVKIADIVDNLLDNPTEKQVYKSIKTLHRLCQISNQ